MILLQTFTTGCKLGWILRPCWFVNVPVIVLAVIIKGCACIHWRIVTFKAFVRILWNPIMTFKMQKYEQWTNSKNQLCLEVNRWMDSKTFREDKNKRMQITMKMKLQLRWLKEFEDLFESLSLPLQGLLWLLFIALSHKLIMFAETPAQV